ncbi:MAG: hypothetical protein ABIH69_04700 [bacterium]|nr:hypothetical protein [Candidatus Margulisiibacteriota bacterium]
MADQVPGTGAINPNMGGAEAAIAGSSGAIFSAQDRKIIQERGGEADEVRGFNQVLREGPLTSDIENIENEESNAAPKHTTSELKGRQRDHKRMLKHSPVTAPREKIEITLKSPDEDEEGKEEEQGRGEGRGTENPELILKEETAAIAKELRLNPTELFKQIEIEQKQLHFLISRIKELHLQRLLAEDTADFKKITERIIHESQASVGKEAYPWLEEQLNKLTLHAAQYKLGLFKSLQTMEFNPERHKNIEWLEQAIEYYASK